MIEVFELALDRRCKDAVHSGQTRASCDHGATATCRTSRISRCEGGKGLGLGGFETCFLV